MQTLVRCLSVRHTFNEQVTHVLRGAHHSSLPYITHIQTWPINIIQKIILTKFQHAQSQSKNVASRGLTRFSSVLPTVVLDLTWLSFDKDVFSDKLSWRSDAKCSLFSVNKAIVGDPRQSKCDPNTSPWAKVLRWAKIIKEKVTSQNYLLPLVHCSLSVLNVSIYCYCLRSKQELV